MKGSVKALVLITISFCFAIPTIAQLSLPGINPGGIAPEIRKVVRDYPSRFANLKGELLAEHAQSADYACNFKVPEAEQVRLTTYSSTGKPVTSWEALLLSTDDFETAKKKFRSLFTQLNHLSVQMDGSTVLLFKGEYENPEEEKGFATVLFTAGRQEDAFRNLKIEISMEYIPMEWKVKVLVYDRDREDHEKGPALEEGQ